MKTIYLILAIVFPLLALTGCKKYLAKKSSTGITVPKTVYDLQALLDNSTDMNRLRTPTLGEASADDYFLLQKDFDVLKQRDQDVYKWMPYDDYRFPNDWSYCYVPIYNADYCLDQIDNLEKNSGNEVAWNNVKGSALFYRAYYFLQLVWTFAKAYDENSSDKDLGIALRLTSDFNTPSVRANVKDSYNRILSDAQASIAYLPNLPVTAFRPSKAAAYGLLARSYLSMRKYDSALKYSNLCLQLNKDLINYNGDADIVNPLEDPNAPFKLLNKETIFYSEMCYDVNAINVYFAKMDTVLYKSYSDNDVRKIAFFTPYNGYQKFKGNYSQDNFAVFTGLATDEMYLIRAECNARKGDKNDALSDLNTLLRKRYDVTFTAVTAPDAASALNRILVERRKELTFRGLRFQDVKRLNKENASITPQRLINGATYKLPPNDNRYALPIPKTVIDESRMPQNPY